MRRGAGARSRPSSRDRKSTRLNSSHSQISYAVFCLKKKNDWRRRRLVFACNWVLQMTVANGYHWAHSHPQSQVVWLVSCDLLAQIGCPSRPDDIQE